MNGNEEFTPTTRKEGPGCLPSGPVLPDGQRVLLLIPAYNEQDRIEATLRRYAAVFAERIPGSYAIVVVLNGCRDQTEAIVNRLAEQLPGLSGLNFPDRIGKGGALIRGLKAAPDADWVGYVDADGATEPEEFLRLLHLCQGKDCVIGSRWLAGAILPRSQPWVRKLSSRVFHAIVQVLFRLGVKDTQCPAKVFSRSAADRVRSHLRIADLAFDVNLLYAIKRAGYGIHEEPTVWTDQLGSKVTQTLFRSSLVMFLSVVRLRLYYSPIYRIMGPLRPLEAWVYHKLRAPFLPLCEDETPSE